MYVYRLSQQTKKTQLVYTSTRVATLAQSESISLPDVPYAGNELAEEGYILQQPEGSAV